MTEMETLTEATKEMMTEAMGDGDAGSGDRNNDGNDKMVTTMVQWRHDGQNGDNNSGNGDDDGGNKKLEMAVMK